MKKFLMAAAAAGALLMSGSAAMAEAVKLQLKWVTQAQVRRLLRGAGQGLLQGCRPRRDHPAGRPGHQPAAGAGGRRC